MYTILHVLSSKNVNCFCSKTIIRLKSRKYNVVYVVINPSITSKHANNAAGNIEKIFKY